MFLFFKSLSSSCVFASLRANFLTRLFTLAGLREAIESGTIELLSSFYLKNKLLFMTHNETNTQELERLLKNKSAKDFQFISNRCRDIIHNTLNSLPLLTSVFQWLQRFP